MTLIKVTINKEENMIKIYNNGKGIPVVEHKEEKVFVPTLIFGHLLTSSNYNDEEKKVTGGRNGYGAKLCNIFSKKFIVETSCKESKKYFKQTWQENMGKSAEPSIKPNKDDDFTSVTFYPDLAKFGMESLEDDLVALLAKRVYDIAASTRGVKVRNNKIFNSFSIKKSFKDFKDLRYIEVIFKLNKERNLIFPFTVNQL